MKVSVVIPAYNEENYIGTCLEKLTSQTISPDEIIVVDNNCKDSTVSIAKKYGATIVTQEIQGMIHARNKGFDHAKYEIIARTDADSQAPPNWIETIKKDFENKNVNCITGPISLYDMFFPFQLTVWSNMVVGTFQILAGLKTLPVGPNFALKKDMWNKIRNYVCLDENIVHEDFDIGLTIDKIGGKVIHDPNLTMMISSRRIKGDPSSFFIEYPIRSLKTLHYHATHSLTSLQRA